MTPIRMPVGRMLPAEQSMQQLVTNDKVAICRKPNMLKFTQAKSLITLYEIHPVKSELKGG